MKLLTTVRRNHPKQIKALALVAGLLAAMPYVSQAATQTSEIKFGREIKVTPTLGYNNLNIEGGSVQVEGVGPSELKAKGGNSVGVLVQMPVKTRSLLFESGLEYMETSSKATIEALIFSFETLSLKMSHLAIPLRAKYVFGDSSSQDTRYFVKGGLMPTILMSAKTNTIDGEIDSKSNLNSMGLLAQAGLGGDWATSFYNGRVSLDLMYNYGLTKVFKEGSGRSSGISINAGYIIEL
jgi:hypothetical protein